MSLGHWITIAKPIQNSLMRPNTLPVLATLRFHPQACSKNMELADNVRQSGRQRARDGDRLVPCLVVLMQDNSPPSLPIVMTCIDTCCAPVTCPVWGQQRDNFTMIP